MATSEQVNGSAAVQGALWGARAGEWAAIQEPTQRGDYAATLDAAGVGDGTRLLDVGCGSGVAAAAARERGAVVCGIDAALAAVEHARARVPDGEFRVAEMEALPYDDGAFDVVCGFNSFQYAADPLHALREARRVARPRGTVAIHMWGPLDDSDAATVVGALLALLPAQPAGGGPHAFSEPGVVEDLARRAGLDPIRAGATRTSWTYPDRATALRGVLSAGPAVQAVHAAGEDRATAAVAEALEPFVRSSGRVVLDNTWRFVIARA
jgi:SAM-dependent methyltransferase